MRAHQRQYTVEELFVLDKLSNLLDFRFTQIHRTVDENAMYLAIFGTFLNFIDIVIKWGKDTRDFSRGRNCPFTSFL